MGSAVHQVRGCRPCFSRALAAGAQLGSGRGHAFQVGEPPHVVCQICVTSFFPILTRGRFNSTIRCSSSSARWRAPHQLVPAVRRSTRDNMRSTTPRSWLTCLTGLSMTMSTPRISRCFANTASHGLRPAVDLRSPFGLRHTLSSTGRKSSQGTSSSLTDFRLYSSCRTARYCLQ